MKIHKKTINIKSTTQVEFIDITDRVSEVVEDSGVRTGQVLIYSPHTSASVIINHNESMLIQDFMRVLYRLVPINDKYSHDIFELNNNNKSDGRSNGHSHCKSMLLGVSETVPVEKGKIILTEKQSVFLVEFDGARTRDVIIQIIGM
ncbi:MAG: isopentenyl-diphosphate delta-isomerase, type 2 [uncultured bacterium]|nr:MAG: isopentenyl-diphosphate delta-isomerase, type 2 [uncultured bacterium]HCU70879.1 secondary thiamine-phosphate synthase enzyme [Candidatus Moranbacteria bacterium]